MDINIVSAGQGQPESGQAATAGGRACRPA